MLLGLLSCTPVRGLVVLLIRRLTTFEFSITVPCTFNTPISVYVGGTSGGNSKEIKISPEAFNLGPISQGSNDCVAGAASYVELTAGKLASESTPGGNVDLVSVQNFGFSVMFSCGMRIVLGTLVTAALALLTLLEIGSIRILSGVEM
jgi:hypothetical protein